MIGIEQPLCLKSSSTGITETVDLMDVYAKLRDGFQMQKQHCPPIFLQVPTINYVNNYRAQQKNSLEPWRITC